MSNYYRIVALEGRESIAFGYDGNYVSVDDSHARYADIRAALLEADYERAYGLYDKALSISKNFERVSERVSLRGQTLYFDGDPVDNELTRTILRFNDEGEDFTPLVNFLEKLYVNNNDFVREQLYRWVADRDLTITDEGNILGYKGVYATDDGFRSSASGHAIVDGVEHTGHIPQQVGSVVEMPRDEVTFDPNVTCSTGLHIGTYDYAKTYGNVCVLVEVNPRDVVSVPVDYAGQKMRACRYKVLEVADGKIDTPVYRLNVRDTSPVDTQERVYEYRVPSRSNPGTYHTVVYVVGQGVESCTCAGWKFRGECRHSIQVEQGRVSIHKTYYRSAKPSSDDNRLSVGDRLQSRKGVWYTVKSIDPQRKYFNLVDPNGTERVVSAYNLPKSFVITKDRV